jgi:hypothetical protein
MFHALLSKPFPVGLCFPSSLRALNIYMTAKPVITDVQEGSGQEEPPRRHPSPCCVPYLCSQFQKIMTEKKIWI